MHSDLLSSTPIQARLTMSMLSYVQQSSSQTNLAAVDVSSSNASNTVIRNNGSLQGCGTGQSRYIPFPPMAGPSSAPIDSPSVLLTSSLPGRTHQNHYVPLLRRAGSFIKNPPVLGNLSRSGGPKFHSLKTLDLEDVMQVILIYDIRINSTAFQPLTCLLHGSFPTQSMHTAPVRRAADDAGK